MQAEMKQGERNAIQEQQSQLGRLSKCNNKHDHVEQGSKNCAEDGSQLDYDEDSDEEEENIVAVEELVECLLDQDDQQLELEQNDTETAEATNTGKAVTQKANYETNLRNSEQCPATSLSSSLAKKYRKGHW